MRKGNIFHMADAADAKPVVAKKAPKVRRVPEPGMKRHFKKQGRSRRTMSRLNVQVVANAHGIRSVRQTASVDAVLFMNDFVFNVLRLATFVSAPRTTIKNSDVHYAYRVLTRGRTMYSDGKYASSNIRLTKAYAALSDTDRSRPSDIRRRPPKDKKDRA